MKGTLEGLDLPNRRTGIGTEGGFSGGEKREGVGADKAQGLLEQRC